MFKQRITRAEVSSVRSIISKAAIRDKTIMLPEDVHEKEWFINAGEGNLALLRQALSKSISELMDMGEAIIAEDLSAMGDGEIVGRNEAIDILAGRSRDVARVNQKSQRYMTWRDMRSIELELSDHDAMEAVQTLEEDIPANIEGLLRIFMSVMWFTGMRPVEIWNSVLMLPRRDIPFTPKMAEIANKNPSLAILEEWYLPVQLAAQLAGETNMGVASARASMQTGAPCLLMIRSAKQTNASAAKTPIRLQVLKDVPAEQLHMFAAASMLLLRPVSEKRRATTSAPRPEPRRDEGEPLYLPALLCLEGKAALRAA